MVYLHAVLILAPDTGAVPELGNGLENPEPGFSIHLY
jgi:hypothetical protein